MKPDNDNKPEASDLLYGVPAIATYLNIKPRQVYHLAAQGGLPTFKLRGKTCGRKTSLDAWLDKVEGDSHG